MAKHALASVEGFKKRREYFTVDPFTIIRSGILSRQICLRGWMVRI